MGNAGVVPPVDHKLRILSGGQADRPLGLGDGRCGLHGRPQDDGHSAGDAPQNAARVVGLCLHPAVLHHKGVVVFGPPGPGGGEAVPKLHALHGGNAEEGGGQPVFHAAEHGLPQSGGKARGGTLNDASHRIQIFPGLQNQRLHPLPRLVVQHREWLGSHGVKQLLRGPQGE